jgi:hypothetical protein
MNHTAAPPRLKKLHLPLGSSGSPAPLRENSKVKNKAKETWYLKIYAGVAPPSTTSARTPILHFITTETQKKKIECRSDSEEERLC